MCSVFWKIVSCRTLATEPDCLRGLLWRLLAHNPILRWQFSRQVCDRPCNTPVRQRSAASITRCGGNCPRRTRTLYVPKLDWICRLSACVRQSRKRTCTSEMFAKRLAAKSQLDVLRLKPASNHCEPNTIERPMTIAVTCRVMAILPTWGVYLGPTSVRPMHMAHKCHWDIVLYQAKGC
jgi:hypothetical protein